MTMLLVVWPGLTAAAEPAVTAEQALQTYRRTFQPTRELDCPTSGPDDIVICGRPADALDPNRLPLPIEREPGEIVRHVGEPATGDHGPCRLCTQPVGIDLNMVLKLVAGVGRLLEDDE
jgi:hypothetical protein